MLWQSIIRTLALTIVILVLLSCSDTIEDLDKNKNTATYSVSLNIFGLSDGTLILTINNTDNLQITTAMLQQSPVVSFDSSLTKDSSYEVAVLSHPTNQKCSIVNGTGVATSDVTDIQVGCFSEITATVESLNGSASINWSDISASEYTLYQSTQENFDYNSINSLPNAATYSTVSSPYLVSTLTNAETYYFLLVANFGGGHHISSDYFVATPNRMSIQQFGTSGLVDWGIDLTVTDTSELLLTGYSPGPYKDAQSQIGRGDIIITKFDNTGAEQWREQSGSTGDEYGRSITTDSNGNIFIAGETSGDFGGAVINNSYNSYVSKYDSNGVFVWAKSFGAGRATAVVIDDLDNVFTTGGGASLGGDCFIKKLDNNGNEIGSQSITVTATSCTDAALDSSNNVYIIGSTSANLDGAGNKGDYDIFIAKYDNLLTSQLDIIQIGSTNTDLGNAIAIDNLDKIYITGMTGGILGDNLTAKSANAGVFISKYDNSFNKAWSYQYDANGYTVGQSIAVDSDGNSYITGNTNGEFSGITNAGGEDLYLLKLDRDGGFLWSKQYGTPESDFGYSIVVDNSLGLVYATGYTYGILGTSGFTGGDIVLITNPM